MKKAIIRFFALAVVVMCIASCQKEKDLSGARFFATMEDCSDIYTKTVLNGNSLFWTTGDKIKIFGNNAEDNEGHLYSATPTEGGLQAGFYSVGTEVLESSTYHAVYPADIAEDSNVITLPAVQNSADGNLRGLPMYAISESNGLSFKCLCGVLKFTLSKNSTSVSRIDITADRVINGTFDVTYNHGNPTLTYRDDESGSNTTTLECTAQNIASGHDFFVYLPAGSYSSFTFRIYDNAGNASVLTTKEGNTVTVERSKYTTITLGNNDISLKPVGAKGGLFTVNSNGDQVWFSQGALEFNFVMTREWIEDPDDPAGGWWDEYPSGYTWSFVQEQYQLPGTWEAHCRWGASGYPGTFGPWYSSAISQIGNITDLAGTVYDWGVYNPITNGGNQAGLWRTPTAAEWRYILFERTGADTKRGLATVNNVRGMILLPDEWTMPNGFSSFTCFDNSENYGDGFVYPLDNSPSYSNNVYTLHQWRQLEAAGAVFLPAWSMGDGDYMGGYFSTTGGWEFSVNYVVFQCGESALIRLIQDAE